MIPPGQRLFRGMRARLPGRWRDAEGDLLIGLVAGVTLANGLSSIGQALLSRFADQPRLFSVLLPFGVHHWARSSSLAFGFLLAYLSLHLFRRRRIAWRMAAATCALAVLAHVAWGDLWYAGAAHKGLRQYKAKFEPRWEDRFLIYHGGPAGLVKTALAVARATEG